ncbi:VirK family protein [Pseudonocardia xinjiangensis]|uniref:Uncharacterized protein n=1 Tax=Pseudonocardia xinjiangensis TaxID=75289 RepID=A0ABX1RHM3_9PSEU|nr:VirK family protein [Pseudonocardia xinjiangensis]NMH78605.1 hypothetical protein [Pseudonocardia xinjiangensis]
MSVITMAGSVVLIQGCASGSAATAPSPDHSEALTTYPQLVTALSHSEDVAIAVSFPKCTAADTGAPGPAVSGGLHINGFQISQDNVAFSDVHQTLDPQSHPVTEYIRYKVTADSAVTVSTTTLAADSHVLRSTSFRCPMNSGASFTGHDG